MKVKTPSQLVLVLVILLISFAVHLRDELLHVPRIRVGPLSSSTPAPEMLRFFVVGNTGTGDSDRLDVAKAMEERCTEAELAPLGALFLLGDNIDHSSMNSVDDPLWQKKMVELYKGPCLGQVPIYPVLGNQDYLSNPAAQIEYTLINPRWHMPNRFYAVTFGRLLKLVAFDSQISEFCFKTSFCALDFLLANVQGNSQAWTVVTAHHGIDTASAQGFAFGSEVRGFVLKNLLCDKADLWLSGFPHHLEHRSFPGCRLEAFVSGGGGADLHRVKKAAPHAHFVESAYGFLELEVSSSTMKERFIGSDDKVLYEATKSHSL